MTITITHKGTTVTVQGNIGGSMKDAIQVLEQAIEKLNTTCNNCTLEKSEGYGK